MSEWRAFIEGDEEGNICIYLQQGDDASSRELYEMVEHDVKDSMPGQESEYLEEAEGEAESRNASDSGEAEAADDE